MSSSVLSRSKVLGVTICILALFLMTEIVSASGELTVTDTYRISHPAYEMANLYQGHRSPFNVDYSRVIMYESGIQDPDNTTIYHPLFPGSRSTGRGTIWGCLTASCVTERSGVGGNTVTATLPLLNLDSLTQSNEKLTEWDNNTVAFPSKYQVRVNWSPYAGETNIVYALCESSSCGAYQYWLVTYNLDTGVQTPIVSYTYTLPDNSQLDVSAASIRGFSKDATTGALGHPDEIIIDVNQRTWRTIRIFTDRQSNGTFGSYKTKTYEWQPNRCSSWATWYPDRWDDIHTATSPDGLYGANYGAYSTTNGGVWKNDNSNSECYVSSSGDPLTPSYWNDSLRDTNKVCHISWQGSNDWFIGADCTSPEPAVTLPSITNGQNIYQLSFNRTLAEQNLTNHNAANVITYNLLISRQSAGYWQTYENGSWVAHNYHTLASPTVSPDGAHLYFQGTNGKYTRHDYHKYPAITGTNWEGSGTYVAYMTSDSGSVTTPPTVHFDLTATAVSETQINLSWSASTDNVGVARCMKCTGMEHRWPRLQLQLIQTQDYLP